MNNLNKKILMIAAILSLLTTYLIFNYLKGLEGKETTVEYRSIIVAAANIESRKLITEEMLKTIEVPLDSYTPNFINSKEEIVGKYTKESIIAGEGIISDRLMAENKIDLTLRVPANKRAITIAVDQFSGVSDLIKPGDYVDIYVTVENVKQGGTIQEDMTKLLLQKIEVLAIGKEQFRSDNVRVETPSLYSVTLALDVEEGEKVILGESIGNIKLALRPLEENSIKNTKGAIKENLVTN